MPEDYYSIANILDADTLRAEVNRIFDDISRRFKDLEDSVETAQEAADTAQESVADAIAPSDIPANITYFQVSWNKAQSQVGYTTRVACDWNDSSDATHYELERKESGGDWEGIAVLGNTNLDNYQYFGLDDGSYYHRVRPMNLETPGTWIYHDGAGGTYTEGSATTITITTSTGTVPGIVPTLAVSHDDSDYSGLLPIIRTTITWTSATYAHFYEIQYKNSTSGTWLYLGSTGAGGLKYDMTGIVIDGQSYHYRIRAISETGDPGSWTYVGGGASPGTAVAVPSNIKPEELYVVAGDNANRGDQSTIAAAVTEASSEGYKGIFIRNGNYTLAGHVSLPDNFFIIGESREGVLIDMDGYNFQVSSKNTSFRFSNFSTKNDDLLLASEHIHILGAGFTPTVIIDNVTFNLAGASTAGDKAVYIQSGEGNVTLLNCSVLNGSYGVYIAADFEVSVTACYFEDQYEAIYANATLGRLLMSDLIVKDYRYIGIYTTSGADAVTMSGCQIILTTAATSDLSSFYGAHLHANAVAANGNAFYMNWTSNDTLYGVQIGAENAVVSGNVVDITTTTTQVVYGMAISANDGTFNSNKVAVDASNSTSNHYGVHISAQSRCNFTGFHINMVNGIDNKDYGLYIASGSNNNVANLITYNCGTADGFYDGGTTTTSSNNNHY